LCLYSLTTSWHAWSTSPPSAPAFSAIRALRLSH
jgi:hypothetical protein